PESFANLAAYYYSIASPNPATPEADAAIREMGVVVDSGLAQFWPDPKVQPPQEIWNLVFLKSILQEVNGNPQEALKSLLLADQLRPRFDSINLNLARLYFRLSKSMTEPAAQLACARNARDRFVSYIQLEFRGRTPPTEISQ